MTALEKTERSDRDKETIRKGVEAMFIFFETGLNAMMNAMNRVINQTQKRQKLLGDLAALMLVYGPSLPPQVIETLATFMRDVNAIDMETAAIISETMGAAADASPIGRS